jgi:Ni/Fe-hydrogenase subunit HybB-like protein
MEFLHVADSVNHLSVAGVIAWIATLVGVATGAFIVFGLPAIFQWRRAKALKGVAKAHGEENT